MSVTALCTIAKRWEQPKRPPANGRISKTWSIHVMQGYPAVKRKKYGYILQHGWTLGACLVKEAGHSSARWDHMIPVIRNVQSRKVSSDRQ